MRNHCFRLALFSCFVLVSHPSEAAGAQGDDALAKRVDALFAHLDKTPSPGIAIVVVRDGKVVFRKGYGLADLEHNAPVTPGTVFHLASCAKQFTGMAVAMLVEQGKVRLEDDIRKYIPEMPDFGKPITVEHLLRHTSGLRDWAGALVVAGWRFDDVISFKDIMNFAYRQKTLNFPPGAEELYSNTGYSVLAELVQRVSGKTWRVYLDETIFKPLGMTNTHVREDHQEVIPNVAWGYSRNPAGGVRHVPDNMTSYGSSSVWSTADDMAKWLLNFETGVAGGKKVLEVMQQPGALNDGRKVQYGFGIAYGVEAGHPLLNHSGGWAGITTFVGYFPQDRLGIVALSNNPSVPADSAYPIALSCLGIGPLPARGAAAAGASAPRPVDTSPAALDALVGLYRLGPEAFVRIKRYGNVLTSQVKGEGPNPLSPGRERDQWVGRGVALSFQRGEEGRVTSLELGGKRAERVDEKEARPPKKLSDFVGIYDSSELKTSYEVALKEGVLELRHWRRNTVPLAWLWHDNFGSPDGYVGFITFERDRRGRVTGLVVNGDPRSRDIRFEKRR